MAAFGGPVCIAALLIFLFTSLAFLARGLLHSDLYIDSRGDLLLRELQGRHREVRRFLVPFRVDNLGTLAERSEEENTRKAVSAATGGVQPGQVACGELSYAQNAAFIGSGYSKAVFGAVLRGGVPVALKFVNAHGADMATCVRDFGDATGCFELVSYKLIKEIALLQRLRHPNIVQLYGHCQPGEQVDRVMSVLERGSPFQMIQLLQSPWEERFRVCLGLARLLDFLSKSPLGSVALLDFQPRQFVLVSGELKLTDLDDASVGDPVCSSDADCVLNFPIRNFSIPCSPEGICQGLNEKRNLYNSYRYFFTYLLPHRAPSALQHLIERIMNSTGELKSGVNDTLEAFEDLLHLYKSGLYLQNLPMSIIKDYTVARGMKASGGGDYRCWPSYDHGGCVLSVHSAREAALLCHSQPHCAGFSLGTQKTWTGRILASFRSGFDSLVPDVNSVVYVKNTGASTPAL
ncbi:hypothetical protein GN956_G23358 [Arapaima gigas]